MLKCAESKLYRQFFPLARFEKIACTKRMAVEGKQRTKLLHCSKNEARVSYALESGPMISFKIG